MHIINRHGIHHTIPDEWKLPSGARRATPDEIVAYETQKPTVAPAAVAAPSLEAASAITERDAEIAHLQNELIAARQGLDQFGKLTGRPLSLPKAK